MKKIISTILFAFLGAALGGFFAYSFIKKQVEEEKNQSEKHLTMMMFMSDWVRFKQGGKSMISYFQKNNYKIIAIYGMSYIGETLVNELEGSNIEIKYGIDKRATMISADFEMITPDEKLEAVDVIVVTSLNAFDEIRRMLNKKVDCPIVSIEDILYEE